MNDPKQQLVELYQRTSKHSNYQILPQAIRELVPQEEVDASSRYEKERLEFLKRNLSFKNKRILDVGGNTGYFSFELLEEGAKEVVYVEGNEQHANFVKVAADYLDRKIIVENRYLDFKEPSSIHKPVDITLLFNVIHHLGDDFGQRDINLPKAKERMKDCINYFANITEYLVLQMGFCWQGDTSKLLFVNGTKKEMIDFITDATDKKWDIKEIGVAELLEDKTVYKPLNGKNIQRDDSLGEFRNRPIFILKGK